MKRFVSLDLETSGLDPLRHEIIEVAVVIEKLGSEQGGALYDSVIIEPVTFSLAFDGTKADARALEVNGWGKRPFPPVWPAARAVGFLAEVLDDVHIIGKNPKFDTDFLQVLFARHGVEPSWHHRLVDIGPLAWGWYNGQEYEAAQSVGDPPAAINLCLHPPNSEKVAELTGVPWPEDKRHSALADATWVYEVFRKIVPYP